MCSSRSCQNLPEFFKDIRYVTCPSCLVCRYLHKHCIGFSLLMVCCFEAFGSPVRHSLYLLDLTEPLPQFSKFKIISWLKNFKKCSFLNLAKVTVNKQNLVKKNRRFIACLRLCLFQVINRVGISVRPNI